MALREKRNAHYGGLGVPTTKKDKIVPFPKTKKKKKKKKNNNSKDIYPIYDPVFEKNSVKPKRKTPKKQMVKWRVISKTRLSGNRVNPKQKAKNLAQENIKNGQNLGMLINDKINGNIVYSFPIIENDVEIGKIIIDPRKMKIISKVEN